jgi:hypothetical protein
VMSDLRRTLEALCEAFNAHDLDAIMAHFADDCVLEMPRGPDLSVVRMNGTGEAVIEWRLWLILGC